EGASVLEACKDLPIAVVSFLTAAYLPRFGYRRAMICGLGLVGAACLAMPVAGAFWMAKLLFVAIGVSFALVKVGVYSSIALLTADRRAHASLTTPIEGLFMVGVLGGYWLFGAFIDHDDPANPAWLDVYYVIAAVCAATIALLAASPLDESAARASDG